VAVGFEFEIAGLAVLLDLETAAGYLGWVVHAGFLAVMLGTVGRGHAGFVLQFSLNRIDTLPRLPHADSGNSHFDSASLTAS